MEDTRSARLTVRVADPDELAVLDAAIPTGRNDVHAAFLRRQEAGDATYLVAWQDGVPVGTGVVRWAGRGTSRDPEITNLQVEPAARGRGAGTALIRFAEDLARGRGFARAAIGVGEDNPRAAALYERLGYTDSGARWTGSYTWYDADGVEHEETEHVRMLVLELD